MRHTADRTATLEREVRTRQEAENDARNARARNDAILDVALDCVILIDESGRIAQFNPAAERTFGYTAAEAVGADLVESIFPADRREPVREAMASYLATGDTAILNRRLELTAIRKSGEAFPVEIAIAPISTDCGKMFAAYVRDITERKRIEPSWPATPTCSRTAHDTQRKDAERLAILVDELRVTQQRAEAATRAKSEFLASMSHELRTPLNAIILYSELLQETAEDEGQTGSIGDLKRIQSAGKHLLDLINGILDLSKIEAGKMVLSLETFQVKTMIGGLVDTVRPLVEKNRNTLTVRGADDVRPMHADLTKTRQILLNLLSNASKFTHDGTITVDIRECTLDGADVVEFSVTDTGVGMTLEQTQKVFDPFTQADVTTTRKYGGTGLGLAIVSRFCDLMGGSVSVESRPGEGSRFVVRLPREMAERPQPSRWCPPAWEPATRRERRNPMATILVVEDNEASRDALARRLQRRGYDVVRGRGRPAGRVGGAIRETRSHPDGPGIAGHRRMGGDAPAESRCVDATHSDHRAERPCHDQRPRPRAGGRRRRLRHQARPLRAADRQDCLAAGEVHRPVTRQGSLLVVDDNDDNRDALSRRLRQKGYRVSVAADGAEALAQIDRESYDLVLLDVEMPGMSGLEVLSRVRVQRSQTQLPVIMVTARSEGADIVEAFGLGANDYVTKPIDFAVALARIRTHLAHKWAVEDLHESEERYALAVRGANDGLWDWNLVTNEVYWSARWKSMLGYDEHEIGASPDEWFSRVHHEDLERVRGALTAHLADGSQHYESEHRILHRNGMYRWVLCRGAAVRDHAGTATRLAGSLTDITETKLADALTGLPNRLLFLDLVERAIKRGKTAPEPRLRPPGPRPQPVQCGQRQPGAAHRRSSPGGDRAAASVESAAHRHRRA